jgi:Rps23 Pro-64 3,4-dihydroxylase Tpa1-like proline 4-hydroxylase
MKQNNLKNLAIASIAKIISEDNNFSEQPFNHLYCDNFFSPEFANTLLDSFPKLDNSDLWDSSNDPEIEVKMRSKWQSEFDIPDTIVDAIRVLNSSLFLKSVSEKFNIPKLMPDPYFTGGGLNVTVSGGLLDVHVDGNYHDASGLNRRINAILYLNPGWQEGWGGEFGLYDETGDKLIKKIAPIHNRLVIFDTNDKSFHGLPDPLNFPEGHARRSIILYYYTKDERPTDQVTVEQPHSALWKKKGVLDKRGNKTRDFS